MSYRTGPISYSSIGRVWFLCRYAKHALASVAAFVSIIGLPATSANGQVLDWVSQAGACYANDGSGSEHLEASLNGVELPTDELTVEAWVSTNGGSYTIVQVGTSGETGGFSLNNHSGSGPYAIIGNEETDIEVRKTNRTNGLSGSRWTHVAVTWSASEDRLRIYRNGDLYYDKIISDTTIGYVGSPEIYIGCNADGGGILNGQVDEVRIWRRALSKEELDAHRNELRAGTEEGLVALYSLDGEADGRVEDLGTQAIHLNAVGTSTDNWKDSKAHIPEWNTAHRQMIQNTDWDTEKEIQPGITWRFHTYDSLFYRRQNLSVLEIDPDVADVHFEISALPDGASYQRTSSVAQANSAVAAVNGSYWHTGGIISDKSPPRDEATQNGVAVYHRVNGVDVAKTYEYHAMPNKYYGTAETVSVDYADDGAFVFNNDSTAFSVIQRPRPHQEEPEFVHGWTGFTEWDNAIASGPLLLQDGEEVYYYRNSYAQWNSGEIPFWWQLGDYPFTAVGTTADGRVFLVTGDGRRSSSQGLGAHEIAQIMLALGCENAVKFDGGGSTTMYIQGEGVVNSPSEGGERSVPSHLLVVPNHIVEPVVPDQLDIVSDTSGGDHFIEFVPVTSGSLMFSGTLCRTSNSGWSALSLRTAADDDTSNGGVDIGRNTASSGLAVFDYLDHKSQSSSTARKPAPNAFDVGAGTYHIIGEVDYDDGRIRAWAWDGVSGSLELNSPVLDEPFEKPGFSQPAAYFRVASLGAGANYYNLRLRAVTNETERAEAFALMQPNYNSIDPHMQGIDISAEDLENGTVQLTWSNGTGVIDNYLVRYRIAGVNEWTVLDDSLPASARQYTTPSLPFGQTYEFQVVAVSQWCYILYSGGVQVAPFNGDQDGDGLNDGWEMKYFNSLIYGATDDPDADGADNMAEAGMGTNPTLRDTDGDLVDDGIEARYGWSPTEANPEFRQQLFSMLRQRPEMRAQYGLYSQEELSQGKPMIMNDGSLEGVIQLQLMKSTDLISWSEVDEPIEVPLNIKASKRFYFWDESVQTREHN